jgi:hypothetical protein
MIQHTDINAEQAALVRKAAVALLDAAEDIVQQIESLAGESSVIDEDLEEGEPLAKLRAAIAAARAVTPH